MRSPTLEATLHLNSHITILSRNLSIQTGTHPHLVLTLDPSSQQVVGHHPSYVDHRGPSVPWAGRHSVGLHPVQTFLRAFPQTALDHRLLLRHPQTQAPNYSVGQTVRVIRRGRLDLVPVHCTVVLPNWNWVVVGILRRSRSVGVLGQASTNRRELVMRCIVAYWSLVADPGIHLVLQDHHRLLLRAILGRPKGRLDHHRRRNWEHHSV